MRKHPALSLLALAVVAMSAATSLANPTIRNAWKADYPDACAELVDAANGCVLCHNPSSTSRNPYGQAINATGSNILAIADLDSDGDTVPNGKEISDCTLPGDPSSVLPTGGETWGAIKSLFR